jgi:hypothetical protein
VSSINPSSFAMERDSIAYDFADVIVDRVLGPIAGRRAARPYPVDQIVPQHAERFKIGCTLFLLLLAPSLPLLRLVGSRCCSVFRFGHAGGFRGRIDLANYPSPAAPSLRAVARYTALPASGVERAMRSHRLSILLISVSMIEWSA